MKAAAYEKLHPWVLDTWKLIHKDVRAEVEEFVQEKWKADSLAHWAAMVKECDSWSVGAPKAASSSQPSDISQDASSQQPGSAVPASVQPSMAPAPPPAPPASATVPAAAAPVAGQGQQARLSVMMMSGPPDVGGVVPVPQVHIGGQVFPLSLAELETAFFNAYPRLAGVRGHLDRDRDGGMSCVLQRGFLLTSSSISLT